MTLEEAKEIMQEWLEYNKKHKNTLREADTIIEVQETVLKALEEYELLKENDEVLRLDLAKALKELGLPEDTIISDELVNMIHERYIPKEKVRELYVDYLERIRYIDDNNFVQDDTYHEYIKICDVLLRILGDDNQ